MCRDLESSPVTSLGRSLPFRPPTERGEARRGHREGGGGGGVHGKKRVVTADLLRGPSLCPSVPPALVPPSATEWDVQRVDVELRREGRKRRRRLSRLHSLCAGDLPCMYLDTAAVQEHFVLVARGKIAKSKIFKNISSNVNSKLTDVGKRARVL